MKFRVHTWQEIRFSYEVEADSAEEAHKMVSERGYAMSPCEVNYDDPAWSDFMIVDPILPNGEVDYENVQDFGVD